MTKVLASNPKSNIVNKGSTNLKLGEVDKMKVSAIHSEGEQQ